MRKFVPGVGIVLCLAGALSFGLTAMMPSKGRARIAGTGAEIPPKLGGSPSASPATISKPESSLSIAHQYAKLPLAFEPNLGQFNEEAKFVARGDGYALFLTGGESVLALKKASISKTAWDNGVGTTNLFVNSASKSRIPPSSGETQTAAVLRMKLVGGNATSRLSPAGELLGKSNYLRGNRPTDWHTNIPNYRKVIQHEAYPGIDIVYYGTQRRLEYDFVVAPGGDPRVIRFAIQGADKLHTSAQGDLVMSVGGGEVRFHKPVAYQEVGSVKEAVATNYVLDRRRNVEFNVGKYDTSRPLIIDPILSYSTYLGGSNIDGANAIAVAPDNTAFIAGGTFSLDFPTVHPLQPNHGGPDDFSKDAFVSKLSGDGSTLLYSTYLGGKGDDVANGIAVDAFGEAYVTGTTRSPDFPVTIGAFNTLCGGDGKCGASLNPQGLIVSNAFVSKLNAAGSALVYSGYLGEYENVKGQAIAVDKDQIAYVTGQVGPNLIPTVVITPPATPPPPFPITPGACQAGFGGATDAFVTKISATGSTIQFSCYLGGSDEEIGYGIAVDATANAYSTGLSYSTDFPATATALQPVNAGAGDAFLAKVNTKVVGPLVYSTLLGGNGLDQGNAVAVDSLGNAYVTGGTASKAIALGFTPLLGAFQPECALDSSGVCEGDAFVAKLDPTQSGPGSLVYFTYLGGRLADSGMGIAVDPVNPPSGNAYVTGSTVSADFPVTSAVFQPKFGGGNADAFVAKLDRSGASLVYSSYLGGTNTDIGYGIAADTSGNAYVAGQTCSLDFPLANPEQATPGGNCDAFVSKVSILTGIQLNPAGLVFPAQSLGTSSQPQTVTLTNGDSPLTIASIAVTGANAGDFAETNTCGASLPPGAQCTITVIFTPSAAGIRKASVTITDDAPGSPQVLNLNGQSSTLTLSASSLSFGSQQVGTTGSNPQSVIATNNGTTAVTFSSITASGDFAETDNCTKAPLQPTTNCVVKVTYTPSTAGSSVGALTLTDNAPGSPQIVLLTGTGVGQQSDFTLSALPSSSAVPAGQAATFNFQFSSTGGFSQPVALSCSGLPRLAACSFSSNPVTPTGTAPTPVTLTITTAVRALAPPMSRIDPDPFTRLRYLAPGLAWLMVFFFVATLVRRRRQPVTAAFGFVVMLLLLMAGCGAGSPSGVPAGTPAGFYQITVTGTSGSLTHTTMLNLQVK